MFGNSHGWLFRQDLSRPRIQRKKTAPQQKGMANKFPVAAHHLSSVDETQTYSALYFIRILNAKAPVINRGFLVTTAWPNYLAGAGAGAAWAGAAGIMGVMNIMGLKPCIMLV